MHCPKIEVTGSWPGWKKKTNTSLLEWGINLPRLSKYPKKWVLNSYLLHHWFQYTSTHTFAWLYSWACGRDLVQRPGAWNIPYIYIPISQYHILLPTGLLLDCTQSKHRSILAGTLCPSPENIWQRPHLPTVCTNLCTHIIYIHTNVTNMTTYIYIYINIYNWSNYIYMQTY